MTVDIALPRDVLLWKTENRAYTITMTATRFVTSNIIDCKPEEERAVNSSANQVSVSPF